MTLPRMFVVCILVIVSFYPCFSMAETVVIVHVDNPIEALTKRQINKLYLGKLRVFPHSKDEVDTVDHPKTSKTYRHFYQSIVHMNLAKLQRYRATYLFSGKGRVPRTLENAEKIRKYVANHKTAIGYLDRAYLDDTVKVIYSTESN
ncbi:hypothetical protein A9Q99_22585 [Gammaproteobacteria bacterium 45_16_T64]|nr:hypothetical protein A9Q99_22585 [Gammaproteobacteria bacterium 45_16_T64]